MELKAGSILKNMACLAASISASSGFWTYGTCIRLQAVTLLLLSRATTPRPANGGHLFIEQAIDKVLKLTCCWLRSRNGYF